MLTFWRPIVLAMLLFPAAVIDVAQSYEPNWESLKTHSAAPEWFRDAKFGIYTHWGVYSVPAYGSEWYPRHMFEKSNDPASVFQHHLKTYGDPSQFGYDKFVPLFKAEKFNAEEWADLYQQAGARFAGPVAEHHDGFAMWDSKATTWDAKERGPQRDITGELATALKKRGLKFVATFHHCRNNLWEIEQGGKKEWTGHYSFVKEHYPQLLENQEQAVLYGYLPREEFLNLWLAKLDEVITQYDPDLIWFDSWLDEVPDEYQCRFLANFYNNAAQNNQQVLVTYKQEDLPKGFGVVDIEKGGMAELTEDVWLTDDTLSYGSWCYTQNLKIKPTVVVLHSLVDIVSKNGQLLLNISPMADGTIPANQRAVLLELGAWLKQYGECIYGTRPFTMYGHGPTTAGKGVFGGIATDKSYTAQDIRYTRNGDTVYAIQLGWPGASQQVKLLGFAKKNAAAPFAVQSVSMLGSNAEVKWEQTDAGVVVTTPATAPNEMAVVYKISTTPTP